MGSSFSGRKVDGQSGIFIWNGGCCHISDLGTVTTLFAKHLHFGGNEAVLDVPDVLYSSPHFIHTPAL